MRFAVPLVTPLLLCLLLLGCDRQKDDEAAATVSIASETQRISQTAAHCKGEHCPTVNIEWLQFSDQDALNQAIESQLINMLQGSHPDTERHHSLTAITEQFIEDADELPTSAHQGWQLQASAQVVNQHGQLLTVALSSYEFTGGAHGMPMERFLHWDLANNQPLTLAELLVDGQQQAFWQQAQEAHDAWLNQQRLDEDFRDSWPFELSDEFYFQYGQLLLHYNVYSIAPYAMGAQTLAVPVSRLQGIIKDEYLRQIEG